MRLNLDGTPRKKKVCPERVGLKWSSPSFAKIWRC